MRGAVLALAVKDLKLLVRNRGAFFFTFIWPLVTAVFFGAVMSGGDRPARIRIAVVDEDGTPAASAFVEALRERQGLDIVQTSRDEALDLVRRGRRTAMAALPRGFGESLDRMFYGSPPTIDVWIDPARSAEASILEGLLFQQAAEGMTQLFQDPANAGQRARDALRDFNAEHPTPPPGAAGVPRFLQELDAFLSGAPATGPAGAGGWQPLVIRTHAAATETGRPRSAFEVTFPQGALWGVIGCVMSFSIGVASERSRGTLLRLLAAPITRARLLLGKALACFVGILVVEAAVFLLGRIVFGVRPTSLALLALAAVSVAVAFAGLMMAIASVGRTEQSAAGAGWAAMLPLAMLGGAMIPLFVMPPWMARASDLSPVKWGILALEGAVWRGFTASDMALPCAILLLLGATGFTVGARAFRTS
jgi:ABC-2 type transport system permease protein